MLLQQFRNVPASVPDGPPCDIIKRLDGKKNAIVVRDWLAKQLGTVGAAYRGQNGQKRAV
jgi:hypothetical protein